MRHEICAGAKMGAAGSEIKVRRARGVEACVILHLLRPPRVLMTCLEDLAPDGVEGEVPCLNRGRDLLLQTLVERFDIERLSDFSAK